METMGRQVADDPQRQHGVVAMPAAERDKPQVKEHGAHAQRGEKGRREAHRSHGQAFHDRPEDIGRIAGIFHHVAKAEHPEGGQQAEADQEVSGHHDHRDRHQHRQGGDRGDEGPRIPEPFVRPNVDEADEVPDGQRQEDDEEDRTGAAKESGPIIAVQEHRNPVVHGGAFPCWLPSDQIDSIITSPGGDCQRRSRNEPHPDGNANGSPVPF